MAISNSLPAINFNGSFKAIIDGHIAKQISDEFVTQYLRVTRVKVLKNQLTGKLDGNNNPITQPMEALVDFKNLSDEQIEMLTVGSFIRCEGEMMQTSSQPEGSDTWKNITWVESWDFIKVAGSKAEREERKAQAEPVGKPVKREAQVAQPVAETPDYSDMEF